jgi:hypothetical protein
MSARAVSFMAVFLGHVAPRHMFVVGDFGVTVFFLPERFPYHHADAFRITGSSTATIVKHPERT